MLISNFYISIIISRLLFPKGITSGFFSMYFKNNHYQPVTVCTLRLAESLIMNDLSLSEEPDRIDNIRIVTEAKNIIIGHTRFLFGCKVLMDIGYRIALDLHCCGTKGHS